MMKNARNYALRKNKIVLVTMFLIIMKFKYLQLVTLREKYLVFVTIITW